MYSLLLDCSHQTNFIGLFNTDKEWLCRRHFQGQPFEALSPQIKSLLSESAVDKTAISHFYTPANPGSQLGIRLTQMFVQSWIKTQCPEAQWTKYNGLYMSARLLSDKEPNTQTRNYLITEKGRMAWSTLRMDNGFINMPKIRSIDRQSLEELPGTVYYLPQVKRWQAPPCPVLEIKYEPMQFLKFLKDLQRSDFDSTQLQESESHYLKWQAPKLKNEA